MLTLRAALSKTAERVGERAAGVLSTSYKNKNLRYPLKKWTRFTFLKAADLFVADAKGIDFTRTVECDSKKKDGSESKYLLWQEDLEVAEILVLKF